jgi:AraC-like DNA-binding protein
MIMEHYAPQSPLAEHIHLFWYFDGILGTTPRERLLPDGSSNVIIDLGTDSSIITGAHSKYFEVEASLAMRVMGIWFKPGGAFRFMSLPASEIRDQHVALDDVWGAFANELRDQLAAAPTPAAKFAITERALLDRFMRGREHHPAVRFGLAQFGHVARVTPVIDAIGISARRFEQVFDQQVGLTPKLFCRIRRFQRVLHLINEQRDIDWTDIALSCGYFDQPHFINDFQAFSGINPTEYVARGSRYVNHVPME